MLGKTDDVAKYRELFNSIKAAFNGAFVAPDGRIKGNTQACYVMAIAFGLVDGDKAKQAAQYLVEDIEKRGNHLSTGFIGTKSLDARPVADRPPGRGVPPVAHRHVSRPGASRSSMGRPASGNGGTAGRPTRASRTRA